MAGDEWLTVLEVAQRLGVTRTSVYGRVKRGTVEFRRSGRWLLVKMPPPPPPKPPKPPAPPPPDPNLLKVPEVAAMLGATPPFVYSMVRAGRLPAQRRGRFHLVHRDDVAAFIESCQVAPGRR